MAEFYIFNNGLMTANTMSGSDQRVINWSQIFLRLGHKINIFTSSLGAERFRGVGFNIYITGRAFLKTNIGLFLVYILRAFKGCLLQFKIRFNANGIIYSSSDLLADVVPAIFMKLRCSSFKLLVGMHLIAPNPFKGFRRLYSGGFRIPSLANLYYFIFQRSLFFLLKRKSSLVLVSNRLDRKFLLRKGFNSQKVIITYGACNVSFDENILTVQKLYDAVYVGRFHEQKGFPDLLKTWKEVVKEIPKAKLIIIGEDITTGNIEVFIKKNNLEQNIQFFGFVGGKRKYDYLAASKVCIFPSYYESFGIVALEAMSCGVPVIAYDLPVFRDIYTQGMLRTAIGNIKGMAKNTIDLISHEDKRKACGKEALEMSRRFSWEETAREILKNLGL